MQSIVWETASASLIPSNQYLLFPSLAYHCQLSSFKSWHSECVEMEVLRLSHLPMAFQLAFPLGFPLQHQARQLRQLRIWYLHSCFLLGLTRLWPHFLTNVSKWYLLLRIMEALCRLTVSIVDGRCSWISEEQPFEACLSTEGISCCFASCKACSIRRLLFLASSILAGIEIVGFGRWRSKLLISKQIKLQGDLLDIYSVSSESASC